MGRTAPPRFCLFLYSISVTRAERIEGFVSEIWGWYAENKRDLPWRDLKEKDESQRAYKILVSEVMLQQTQVPRVIVIYKRFLREFPTLSGLAHASNREVILAWRGMGYNSRALRLRDAAITILEEFDGEFPKEMEELKSIKGIGHYTAAAVRNFAFNLPTPCLDTNIRRVLHRAFIGPQKRDGTFKKDDRYLLRLAEEVLHEALKVESYKLKVPGKFHRSTFNIQPLTSEWHAALMDYGSLALPKARPKKSEKRKEPGRFVGSTYIPNRIFRGKIVEELRDTEKGMTPAELGRHVCADWTPSEHTEWLQGLLKKLEGDALVMKRGRRYVLSA